MKFREFVGEKKAKEVKKRIVQTKLGPTEAEFLKVVARENPDGTKRNFIETYFGYGLSKKILKRPFDYIKSWLIRYDVPFEPVNPYLTTYLLRNLPSTSELIKNVKKLKKGVVYNPLGTLTVISNDEKIFPRSPQHYEPDHGKDYLVLDYVPNMTHVAAEIKAFNDLNIDVIDRFCHVKLFEVESGIVGPTFYEQMMYGAPPLPKLRLGNIGLIRRNKNAYL
jgi:hypothetical protein